MKSNINFTPSSKQGYSIKNGLLYEFKRNSVNVSRPWPPCKYTKTSKKPFWHYSPTHKITLHFMALKYSVNLEKGMIALGSSEVLEGESPKVVKSAENLESRRQAIGTGEQMTDKSSLNGLTDLSVERFQRLSDENRKMIEEAFWARYALPALGSEDDPHWQKSFANQRKWTPVIASFYDNIPLNVREMMLANTEGAWNICAFYARCPGADELMNTSPAIGFMLSNFPVFRPKLKRKWDAVRRIMNKPRRKILSWLGWPDSEAVAKILSKIRYQACDRTALLILRAILKKNPALIKPISHLKAINAQSLGFICRNSYRKHASWRFISELALIGEEIDDNMNNKALGIQRMFIDTLSMEKMLLATHGQIQSIAHLRKRHQLAIDEVNRHEISELEKSKAFPSPPVPAPLPTDNFEIYPLDSPLKLYKEAQEQHNCVFACYRERVVESEGNIYIYSMRKPERATVEVEFDSESKSFLPGEVKGPSNKPVSTDTIAKIIVWLSTMGKKSDAITYDENSHDNQKYCDMQS